MNTYRRPHIAGILLASALSACMLASCSDALLAQLNDLIRDANTPTISPPAGTVITAHETLTLVFPSALTPSAVAVSGNLGASYDSASWSDEKTLALNPGNAVAWDAGAERTLTISLTENGETATYDFTFEVFDGVCVSKTGNDASAGTALAPRATVNAGIAQAASLYSTPSTVYIAQGTYASNYFTTGHSVADMIEGVSLLGGFSPNSWLSRDTSLYETILEDISSTGGTSLPDANRAVDIGSNITVNTSIRGFTIKLGSGGSNVAAFCSGSPTISECILQGRESGYGEYNYCIYSKASGVFSYNTIRPYGSSSETQGIYLEGSTATISHNHIYGGWGPSAAYGISTTIDSTSPTLAMNTIDMSSSPSPLIYCIYIALSHPAIEDNIFYFANGDYAIYEASSELADQPASLRRNDFGTKLTTWINIPLETTITYDNYDTEPFTTDDGTQLICDPNGWANYSSAEGFGISW
jgi:hypothetical protein